MLPEPPNARNSGVNEVSVRCHQARTACDCYVVKLFNRSFGRVATVDIHNIAMHNAVMLHKELVAATSVPLVLLILNEGDSYGYQIIQRVSSLTDEELKWTDSMLYPVLHRMEKQKLVQSYWKDSPTGRKRKYYSITREGLEILKEKARQWQILSGALNSFSFNFS